MALTMFSTQKISLSLKVVITIVTIIILWMLSGTSKHHDIQKPLNHSDYIVPKFIASKVVTHQKYLKLNGLSEGSKVVDLKSEAEGKINKIYAEQGQVLNKGDIILEVDSKNIKEKIEYAKAELKNKNIVYSSAVNLFDKKLSSDVALNTALSSLKEAQSNLKSAMIELDNTKLVAPFDGKIDVINVNEGEYLSLIESKILARFFSYNPMKIIINVSQNNIRDVKPLTIVKIETLSHRFYEGRVIFISSLADNETKTFRVEIEVKNENSELLSGEMVDVYIPIQDYQAHSIPQSAILLDSNNNTQIKVLNDDKSILKKNITIVDESVDNIWVTGLSDLENIIIQG